MRFLSLCQLEETNYLEFKDKLYENETVDSLYEKIKVSQAHSEYNKSVDQIVVKVIHELS
jgi:hypothetical protein